MEAFFAEFEGFKYDPTNAPELEFERLQLSRNWKEGTKPFRRHRQAFLKALVAKTGSPVHRFFVETYNFPPYDHTANPRSEFARLAIFRKWNPAKPAYKKAEKAFNHAFNLEFGTDVLDFFDEYREMGFDYNPRATAVEELHRLADFFDWGWKSSEWRTARSLFYDAIRAAFNETFGRDDGDIVGWQYLCRVLGVNAPEAQSAEQCRIALEDINVNIYDLLDYAKDGMPSHRPLKFFATEKELSEYSYFSEPSKVYPREDAKRGALQFILREISKYRTQKPKREEGAAPVEGDGTSGATKKRRGRGRRRKPRVDGENQE